MKRLAKGIIIALSAISAVSLSVVGVTYAASYVAPSESKTYSFGSMDKNFQTLYHYFDSSSGSKLFDGTGDGSKTTFALGGTPVWVDSVFVQGVHKVEGTDYSISGSNIVFASAPGDGLAINVRFHVAAGTSTAPYIVKTSQHLRNLAKLQNSGALPLATYVSLGTSFQWEGDAMEPIGTTTYPFTGVFNGEGFLITGLKVSTSTLTNVGMFGVVGDATYSRTGTVRNLVLAGPQITTSASGAIKLGVVAGVKTTSPASSVEDIEIYGGTSAFKTMRAKVTISNATTVNSGTSPNGVVGQGGSSRAGFVTALSSSPTYASTATWSGISGNTTYYIWNNNGTVANSN